MYNLKFVTFRSIGTTILYLLPIAAISGVFIPLALGMGNLSLLSLYMAAPMVFSFVLYQAYCKDQ